MKTILHAGKHLLTRTANKNRISLFEIKSLYDAAYAEKARARASLKRFRTMLKKAAKLDASYRAQLMADRAQRYGQAV